MKSVMGIVLILSSIAIAAGKRENDGYWWTELPTQYRLGYVWGYLGGMAHANGGKLGQCLSFAKDLQQLEFPKLSLKDVVNRFCTYPNDDYDGITVGQYVDGVTNFYSDYRNKQLPIDLAIEFTRDAVKGMTDADLNGKVEFWRRCQSAYLSGDSERTATACNPDKSPQK